MNHTISTSVSVRLAANRLSNCRADAVKAEPRPGSRPASSSASGRALLRPNPWTRLPEPDETQTRYDFPEFIITGFRSGPVIDSGLSSRPARDGRDARSAAPTTNFFCRPWKANCHPDERSEDSVSVSRFGFYGVRAMCSRLDTRIQECPGW